MADLQWEGAQAPAASWGNKLIRLAGEIAMKDDEKGWKFHLGMWSITVVMDEDGETLRSGSILLCSGCLWCQRHWCYVKNCLAKYQSKISLVSSCFTTLNAKLTYPNRAVIANSAFSSRQLTNSSTTELCQLKLNSLWYVRRSSMTNTAFQWTPWYQGTYWNIWFHSERCLLASRIVYVASEVDLFWKVTLFFVGFCLLKIIPQVNN